MIWLKSWTQPSAADHQPTAGPKDLSHIAVATDAITDLQGRLDDTLAHVTQLAPPAISR